ncbi:MAG: efflux RND transporter periplasmic adaptor subunit [Limisphaerales bacterium]
MANPKSKRRGRKILVFTVILLVIGGLAAAALLRKREPLLTVQTEKVTRRTLTELVVANGRVQPVFYVKMSPEVSGEIIELPVKEGQTVKKGDLLAKIKPDMYLASRNSSEASYKGSISGQASVKANLVRAEAEFRRIEELFKNNLVSESVFVDARATFDMTAAQLQSSIHQVEMSSAALQRAEEDLQKTVIRSPLDGTIIRLNSQLGERVVGTAMMAGTEMMTIADLSEMEARVEVGEVDVPLIQIGQAARIEADAFQDRKFGGVVTEIANSSRGLTLGSGGGGGGQSQDATKFEVKIRIKDKESFRSGMSVTAEIETRYRTNVLTVPIASVTTRLPKSTNTVANATNTVAANSGTNSSPTPAAVPATNETSVGRKPGEAPKPIEVVFIRDGDLAKMVPVKRGISDDAHTEITEGLEEGQEVIAGGYRAISRELEDGKKIKVGPAAFDKAKPEEKK